MTQVAEPALQSSPARSQAELAYGLLVEKITTLELEPGRLLLDRELTEQLGVGRTPIREALQRLSTEGLVVHYPHRGMAVSEITAKGTRDIYEFRSLIDGDVARLAAQRANVQEINDLQQIATSLDHEAQDGSPAAYVQLDREFYSLLGKACRNRHLEEALPRIFNLHLRLWFYISKMKGDWRSMAQAHSTMALNVTEAIANRDASAAELAIRSYVLQRQKDMRVLM